MTNEEILKKAIKKAIKNGWMKMSIKEFEIALRYWDLPLMIINKEYWRYIFSHDFAKAFWGEESAIITTDVNTMTIFQDTPSWQYHLQQMVLEKDPIKYLEQFI